MSRPILPCRTCKTSEFVWVQPEQYGEAGRSVRFVATCEKCGDKVYPSAFMTCDTPDEALGLWNERQRNAAKDK